MESPLRAFAIPLTATAAASLMLIGASNAVAATTLFDTTVQGPVGGAELCVDTTCKGIGGARDIHLTGTFSGPTTRAPGVQSIAATGCTGNVNIGFRLTAPSSAGGLVTVLVEYQPTDKNGGPVGPVVSKSIVLPLPPVPGATKDVTLCASALN